MTRIGAPLVASALDDPETRSGATQIGASAAERHPSRNGVRILQPDECWRLLTSRDLGRLAVQADEGVDVFPVNYLVFEHAVYFRSAPGSKLIDLTRAPRVAFEVDGQLAHHLWSVVIHGVANRLGTDSEITASGVHNLETAYPSDKFNYVRITPTRITGRNVIKA